MTTLEQRKEIFNTVKEHLLKQGERALISLDDRTKCAYRGGGGNKCAVGCLIKDEFYSLPLEHLPCTHFTVRVALSRSLGTVIDTPLNDMLFKLQSIHDNVLPIEWDNALDKLEQEFFN